MTYQKDYSSREKTTSKADLQCTHKAINGLSSSNGEMLEILSEKAGFISRKSFDEACQALAQSSSHTRSSDMSLDTHEYVRSPCPSAFIVGLSLLFAPDDEQ